MKFRYVLFLLISVLTSSCQQKTTKNDTDNLQVFNIEELWSNKGTSTFSLAKYVESVEYIPLETDSNCLVGGGGVLLGENLIYQGGFLFDKTGKFLRKLGKRGPGSEEYVLEMDIAMDETRKEFYVLPTNRSEVMVYNMENNSFKKSIKIPDSRMGLFNLGEGLVLISRNGAPYFKTEDDFFEYYVLSIDSEEVVYKRTSPYKELVGDKYFQLGIQLNRFWYLNGVLQYYEHATDTVYSLNNKGEVCEPRYFMDKGKYKETIDDMKNTPRDAERIVGSLLIINNIHETDSFFKFTLILNMTRITYLFDKKDKTISISKKEKYKNDYDGILTNLGANNITPNKGYSIIRPDKISSLKKDEGYNETLFDDALKKLSMIEEDDNPIIAIIDYKRSTEN